MLTVPVPGQRRERRGTGPARGARRGSPNHHPAQHPDDHTNIARPVRTFGFAVISLDRNAHKLNDAATTLEMSSPLVARDHAP